MVGREAPILVVGAGTTGLTMACELARHGAPVRIVEKLPSIVPYCRATGIHSRTLEIFQDLGVVDQVLAQGEPVCGISQYANGERFMHARYDKVDSPYPFTIALEQWHTEEILEGLLRRLGVAVERQTEFVAMEDLLDGVRATLRHSDGSDETLETPWLVACDGAHSRVRHLNHQRFPGEVDPRQYILADVVVETPHAPDEIHTFLTDRGALFFFPLPKGRTLVVADMLDFHDGKAETPSLEEIRALVTERGPAGVRVRDPRWLSYFRIHYRVSRHYRHGRTLLAGDAVHIHSPIGGQGMNTGIQDAYNLAWKLALVTQGRAPQSLLDSYEKERRAVAEDVVQTTKAMTDHAEIFRDLSEADRERLYFHAVVPEAERLRERRHTEELDLDYRKSPICAEHLGSHEKGAFFSGGPHAGAEALDAGPLFVGDRKLALFELLRGSRHTMLLFLGTGDEDASRARLADLAAAMLRSYRELVNVYLVDTLSGGDADDSVAGAAIVRDPEGALHRRYGADAECLYLIRPDGYVGYRSEPASLGPLREYLGRVFLVAPR